MILSGMAWHEYIAPQRSARQAAHEGQAATTWTRGHELKAGLKNYVKRRRARR